jgi:shikimate kinase
MTTPDTTHQQLSYIRANLARPVVLVGLMGSGKSRMGRKLAHTLELDFYDTDALIEQKAGYSINEIFAQDGEAKFRAVERSTMIDLLGRAACVVATGGGMVTNAGIPDLLTEKSVTIWLRASISDILNRLKNAQNRPLLKAEDPAKVLEGLNAAREPLYRRAHITIDTGTASADDTEILMIRALYDFLKNSNLQAT